MLYQTSERKEGINDTATEDQHAHDMLVDNTPEVAIFHNHEESTSSWDTSSSQPKSSGRKLKRFLSKSKGCRVVKSTTGQQCKLTRNKHGMVTRLTC